MATAATATEGAEAEPKATRCSVPVEPTHGPPHDLLRAARSAPPPLVPLRLALSAPPHATYAPEAPPGPMLDALREDVVAAMRHCVRGFGPDAEEDVRAQWAACATWAAAPDVPRDRAHCGCVRDSFRVLALAALRMYTMPAPRADRTRAVYYVLNAFLRERTAAAEQAAHAPPCNPLEPWNNYLWFLLLAIRSIRYGRCETGKEDSSSESKKQEAVPEKLYHGTVVQEAGRLDSGGTRKLLRSVVSASADAQTAKGFGEGCVVVLHGAGPRLCGIAPASASRREREYLFEPMTLFDPPVAALRASDVGRCVEPVLFELRREDQTRWLLDWKEDFMQSLCVEKEEEEQDGSA